MPSTAAAYSRLATISGGNDVAGHARDKELSDRLIEDHLHRHARIGAGEDRGKRFLLLQGLLQHGEVTAVGGRAAARESAVPGQQLVQRGGGAQIFSRLRSP